MRVLHVCNWCSGITTRNVAALKAHSSHYHELVTRILHPYEMGVEPTHLTERDTTRDMVLGLAEEADVLHFHAVGYDGTVGLPETIHGIDWSKFLGKKLFILHGMCSDLQPDGTFILRHGERFAVRNLDRYDALMGPHLSCKKSYQERLLYVPDVVPIWDWLYMPAYERTTTQKTAATFKDPQVVSYCRSVGLDVRFFPTPTKLTLQLEWRRRNCRATFDNCTDGHWGLFGIESLSQGIPSIAHTAWINRLCWDILGVEPPPFFDPGYGNAEAVAESLKLMFELPEVEYMELSQRCRKWVRDCYHPRDLVKRWDAVYDEVWNGGRHVV